MEPTGFQITFGEFPSNLEDGSTWSLAELWNMKATKVLKSFYPELFFPYTPILGGVGEVLVLQGALGDDS